MHAVATRQEHDGGSGRKHVRMANWTVRFKRSFDTLVRLETNAHAGVASIAVEVIDIESLANAADLAFFAMVNRLVRIVIVKLAYFAEIACKVLFAFLVDALFGHRLRSASTA